jgi:hypothetical protein
MHGTALSPRFFGPFDVSKPEPVIYEFRRNLRVIDVLPLVPAVSPHFNCPNQLSVVVFQ